MGHRVISGALVGLALFGSAAYSYQVQLHEGWNLIGAGCRISNQVFNNEAIKAVWRFVWEGNRYTWQAYSPDPQIQQAINNMGYETLTQIEPWEGFWVYVAQGHSLNLTLCEGLPQPPTPPQASGDNSEQTQTNWLVLVYMAADNNLAPFAQSDLQEINRVQYPSSVKVVALVDTPQGTKIYATNNEGIFQEIQNLGQLDTGNPNVLKNFVRTYYATYNPEHIALILWDHGDNWRTRKVKNENRLVAIDESSGDILFLYEVRNALRELQNEGINLDILGLDLCLAGSMETLYALKDYANYIVASEKPEPGDGWYYTGFLSQLAQNPSMSAENLAKAIVDSYSQYYQGSACEYMGCTLAAYPSDIINNLVNDVNNLADYLSDNLTFAYSVREALPSIDAAVPDTVDLGMLAGAVSGSVGQSIREDLSNIYFKAIGADVLSLSGVSIVFPENPQEADPCYFSTESNECSSPYGDFYNVFTETQWDDFLQRYLQYVNNYVTNHPQFGSAISIAAPVVNVLSWQNICDLDSHLIKIKNGEVEYHVYYGHQSSDEAELLGDNLSCGGQEELDIHSLDNSATYIYFVHNFGHSGSFAEGYTTVSVNATGVNTELHATDDNVDHDIWVVYEIVNGQYKTCISNCYMSEDSFVQWLNSQLRNRLNKNQIINRNK